MQVTHTVLATPEVLQAIGGNQHHGDKQQEQQQDGQPQSRQQQCTTTASGRCMQVCHQIRRVPNSPSDGILQGVDSSSELLPY